MINAFKFKTMNGTPNKGNYLPKSVNIIDKSNNYSTTFKKSPEEKLRLKQLKKKEILYFQNKTIKSFDSIG